jgi:hypothetical protein
MPVNHEQMEAAVAEMVRKNSIAIEGLTEQQIAEAIKQAALAGDFTRHIYMTGQGHAQSVTYIPYQGVEDLRAENARLVALLREHSIEPYPDY